MEGSCLRDLFRDALSQRWWTAAAALVGGSFPVILAALLLSVSSPRSEVCLLGTVPQNFTRLEAAGICMSSVHFLLNKLESALDKKPCKIHPFK